MWSLYKNSFRIIQNKVTPSKPIKIFSIELSLFSETIGYVDVVKEREKKDDVKIDNSSFLKAITTVILADITMSLDNVLGVAGAARDHYHLLVFGLALSIVLMATAATLISGWIKKLYWARQGL